MSDHGARITGRLVIATHNSGKLPRCANCLRRMALRRFPRGNSASPSRKKPERPSRPTRASRPIAAAKATNLPAFADDSGLVVEALHGATRHLFGALGGRGQEFFAAMTRQIEAPPAGTRRQGASAAHRAFRVRACAWHGPTDISKMSKRRVDGTLVWPPRGTAGFGYDPMFLPDGHSRTFGEMTSDRKAWPAAARRWACPIARARFVKLAEMPA
jgi:XTP/dITP diphosphohydrolase